MTLLARRTLLAAAVATTAAAALPRVVFAQTGKGAMLPPLPYGTDALEPHIDTMTMGLHHGKHHQAFIDNLNKAFSENAQLASKSIPELLMGLKDVPEGVRTLIRNSAGGHANHSMFWTIMGPKAGGNPTGAIATAIDKEFGGFDAFKKSFNDSGLRQFGSGWVFLTSSKDGKLKIASRPNQDNPMMDGEMVVMGNDVWEHAYYLKYNNRRGEYLANWWNVVNWAAVNERYAAIKAGKVII